VFPPIGSSNDRQTIEVKLLKKSEIYCQPQKRLQPLRPEAQSAKSELSKFAIRMLGQPKA
jgi:hypothetical protein